MTNEQYEDSEYNISGLRENEYDNRGGILSNHYESTSDDYSYISDTDYELDDNGFPVVQTHSWSDSGEDGESESHIENEFDAKGKLVKTVSDSMFVSEYTYYENGAVQSLVQSDTDDPDYQTYYEYEWDDQGFLTYSHSSYVNDGVSSYEAYEWLEWEFDENGLPIGVSVEKEDIFDSTDTDDWSYEWYDVETDKAGNIMSISNDSMRIEYEYVKIKNPNAAAQLRSNTVIYAI